MSNFLKMYASLFNRSVEISGILGSSRIPTSLSMSSSSHSRSSTWGSSTFFACYCSKSSFLISRNMADSLGSGWLNSFTNYDDPFSLLIQVRFYHRYKWSMSFRVLQPLHCNWLWNLVINQFVCSNKWASPACIINLCISTHNLPESFINILCIKRVLHEGSQLPAF